EHECPFVTHSSGRDIGPSRPRLQSPAGSDPAPRSEAETGLVHGVAGAETGDRGREPLETDVVEHPGGEEVTVEPRALEEERARISDGVRAEARPEVLILVEVANEHAPEPGRGVLGSQRANVLPDVGLAL